jgi:hypothetical protein
MHAQQQQVLIGRQTQQAAAEQRPAARVQEASALLLKQSAAPVRPRGLRQPAEVLLLETERAGRRDDLRGFAIHDRKRRA